MTYNECNVTMYSQFIVYSYQCALTAPKRPKQYIMKDFKSVAKCPI